MDAGAGGRTELAAHAFAEVVALYQLRGWPGAVQLLDFARSPDQVGGEGE
jgi:hypothetical protein